jgi:hypothetical protein
MEANPRLLRLRELPFCEPFWFALEMFPWPLFEPIPPAVMRSSLPGLFGMLLLLKIG